MGEVSKKESYSNNTAAESAGNDQLSLHAIAVRVLSYWKWFIVAAILSVAVSYIYLRYVPKVYRVQARVVVNDDDQERSSSGLLRFQFDGTGLLNETEKEVEIMQSRKLLSMVVKKLSLQARLSKQGKLKSTEIYGENAPISLTLYEPDSVRQVYAGFVSLEGNGKIKFLENVYPLDSIVETPFGRVMWRLNKVWGGKDIVKLDISTLAQATKGLKQAIKVTPINSQSSIVDIVMLDEESGRAKVVLESLLNVYSTNYIDFKRRIAQNTLDFVDERLTLIAGELNDVENDLERFKADKSVVDLSAEGQLFLNQVAQNDIELSRISVQLEVLNELKRYVTRRNNESIPVPATLGLEDHLLQSLLGQLFEAERELEMTRQLSGPKNPQISVLETRIERLKPSILQSIENLSSNLRQSQRSLKSMNSTNEAALRKLPQKERKLLDISRQQTIKNSIYTFLLQKREEAAIQSASVVPNNRIIDMPEIMGLETPKRILVMVLSWAFFLGLLAVYIFIKEFSNPYFIFKEDLQNLVGQPIVGELVYSANNQRGVVVVPGVRNIINEQFRELRTNITFLNKSKDSQTILVTSSKSGEGKSFVSVNLAISLAHAGRKVVLLEFDLRKPKLHQYLGVKNYNGLSNFLVGNIEEPAIVRPVDNVENLFIITSGPLPPNPSELLMQKSMDKLFHYLKDEFEYIIIDAPPVGLVTDAKLIGPYADTCLYVVRYDYTEKSFGQLIKELQKNENLPSINVVFNAVSPNKRGAYGYGYNYGYGYGYGYTEELPSKKITLVQRVKGFFS